jgi:ABC-2 type transport system permease protein
MMDRETRLLFGKEWRQLFGNRTVMLSTLLFPLMVLGVAPLAALSATDGSHHRPDALPRVLSYGMVGEINDDPRRLAVAMLPLLLSLTGLIVPTILVTHTIIGERETRTLELLVALPVRIQQVLVAKLAAVLAATSLVTAPLLAIVMVTLLVLGVAAPRDVAGLPVLLACALAFGVVSALVVSLLAKDYRTANHAAGPVLVPAILVTILASTLLPGGVARPLGLGALYLVGAAVMVRIVLRVVTFERLMRS